MTTPLFLLRCVQIGLSIRDLDLLTIGMVNDMYAESLNDEWLTIGMVNDMYAESRNDECHYATLATQEDFDRF